MDLDLDSLVAAADAEQRDVDLSGVVLRSGWENVVLETADGWILRFPRAHVDFDRELSVLRRLAGRLPVRIPEVEWTGRRTKLAAYRKLSGHSFDLAAYEASTAAERNVLAASLARFLAAMHHALSAGEIAELRIPDLEFDGGVPQPFEDLPPDVRRFALDLIAEADALRAERERSAAPKVLLHNDFHFGNMVLSGPVGEVVGVWDFSCVATGDPSDDLRYLSADSLDLTHRVAEAYEAATGVRIDARAATLAGRIEAVFDAIETGKVAELPETIRSWRRADWLPRTTVEE